MTRYGSIQAVRAGLIPAVGVVAEGLRVDFAAANVLDAHGEGLSLLDALVCTSSSTVFRVSQQASSSKSPSRTELTDVDLLHLAVLGHDDLAVAVHGHGRLLAAQLAHSWEGRVLQPEELSNKMSHTLP